MISRSIIREVREILVRFKKILAQKVEEIRIEKNLGSSKYFQIEKNEIENFRKFTVEIINIFKISEFFDFSKILKMLIISTVNFQKFSISFFSI